MSLHRAFYPLLLILVFLVSACSIQENAKLTHQLSPQEPITTAQLFVNTVLPETLVPVGSEPSLEDNRILALALEQFAKRSTPDDVTALTDYLTAYPKSPWRVAVLTNLGLLHYNEARFSQALSAFDAAWQAGKTIQGFGQDKFLVDKALGVCRS